MKKLIFLSSIVISSMFGDTTNDLIKNAYTTGIYDSLAVLSKDIQNLNKLKELKGYAVYVNISNMPMIDIIKYEAFGIKIGLEPILTKDKLIFSVKERKADAELIQNIIKEKSSLKPKIKYIDEKIKPRSIIEEYLNKKLPQKVLLVYVKEKNQNGNCEIKEIKKVEVKGELHLINRILSTKSYNKNCQKECPPKINTNEKTEKQTKKNIKSTIGKKHFDLKGKNFYQLSKIIANFGVITKDNKLILGDRVYEKGDKLNENYIINYINYDKGIITIDKNLIKVKKQ